MTKLQKKGGIAACYLAAAYVVGIMLFIFVLDYPNIVEPAEKVALLIERQAIITAANLLMYVIFGVFLVLLVLTLHEWLRDGAPSLMWTGTAIIWAGAVMLSGMVANAGIAPVSCLVALIRGDRTPRISNMRKRSLGG